MSNVGVFHPVMALCVHKAEPGTYLHHVSGGQLQQYKRVISIHTFSVCICRLHGVLAAQSAVWIAEELTGGAHEHVVVQQCEWTEAASGDEHILFV